MNAINSSSSNNRKLQSLLMIGFGPKREVDMHADELCLHFVVTLQLWLAVKIALAHKPYFCLF